MTAHRIVLFRTLCVACLSLGLAAPMQALQIVGDWTRDGNAYVSPPATDLPAFRDYFADVLRLYDRYAAVADELAAGIEAVGPWRLSPTSGEVEQGFGADLDATNVGFNPLATGGTAAIASGGEFVDPQLGTEKNKFEIAEVDVEKNVFRQDFGPVQAERRLAPPPGGDPNLEWYSFTFRAEDLSQPFPAPAFFTPSLRASFAVVPEPGAFALATLAAVASSRRRGRR